MEIIMAENRLNIISAAFSQHSSPFEQSLQYTRTVRIKEMQAKFERLWLIDSERFNPLRNCLQKERLERTWQLLTNHVNLNGKRTADIGCGAGDFSRRMRDAGGDVEAVDIAENALKRFKEVCSDRIQLKQDAMPTTTLPDHAYDVIICTELIAELSHDDYRLFFAELSRMIKEDGRLICSSNIDIDSIGATEKFIELAQTEFEILEGVASYHAFYLRLRRFFETPSQFIKGWQDRGFKRKELDSRRGFNRWWFWLNTSFLFVPWWIVGEFGTRPIRKILKNNRGLLLWLEKICRFISDQDGISHYLFIAKRRPLKG
jgi:2-polyprenyl-3-methyl-5-hydroxy-6-metoxy-1,4-benzoquinol methylase